MTALSETTSLDPVTFAVIRNGLTAAVREMFTVFKRTTTFPGLYEYNDFGMSLYDADLNMLADAPGLPIFVGSLDAALRDSIAVLGGPEALHPGDIIVNNHPFLTGGHPPDAAVVQPVFFEGEIIAYSVLRAHMGDVGSMTPYPSSSTEMWQEGTIYPAVKLYRAGELNEEFLRMVRVNSRMPNETAGNFLAAAGALRACSRKLLTIVERYGLDRYRAANAELLDQGERAARAAIARIPDGNYVFEDYLDNDGVDLSPIKLRCTVTIDGSDVTIDFTGSDPTRTGPLNCPLPYTVTAARFALKRITTPERLANSGEHRMLTVIAPENTVCNPQPPAPTFLGAWTCFRISDMIVHALAQAADGWIPAQNGGDSCSVGGLVFDPWTGKPDFFTAMSGLGYGGLQGHDGMDSRIHPTLAGGPTIPVEMVEQRTAVRCHRFELAPDSGGPGEFRGGLSVTQEWELLCRGQMTITAEKSEASTVLGLAGGESPPYRNSVRMISKGRETRTFGKADVQANPGDIFLLAPAGGGGYGNPLHRDPQAVARDVREGYVSRKCAHDAYGVVLDADGKVAEKATIAHRKAKLAG
ncbi:hydantoinase B/oxoprolinase family protein [Amycolatopsis jejuensis]|uniref:hydantoinase B/oxoprolinase family protein n=1 Tax=Amycolatopsis jejuensis TaxID=330084 RepID=UPI00052694B2|nr:hydantoinase B/oxoprolinase family protein [Amycolatopsis jejuensis]